MFIILQHWNKTADMSCLYLITFSNLLSYCIDLCCNMSISIITIIIPYIYEQIII